MLRSSARLISSNFTKKNLLSSTTLLNYSNFSTSSNDTSSINYREQILAKSLKYVPTCGFTHQSLSLAIQELDLPPHCHTIIQNGPSEIVEYLMTKKRMYIKEQIDQLILLQNTIEEDDLFIKKEESQDSTSSSSTSTIKKEKKNLLKEALQLNFQYLRPYQRTWPQALSLSLLFFINNNSIRNLNEFFLLIDDLCYYHESPLPSRLDWYSERFLMSLYYIMIELYYLTDESEDIQDTM